MLSTRELFYGMSEPVWISRDQKKDGKGDEKSYSGSKGSVIAEYPIYTSVPYYPFYIYTQQYVPYRARRDDDERDRNEGRNEYRNEGRNEYRSGGKNEYRNEGRHEYRNEGRNEYWNEGRNEYRNEGRNEYRNEDRDEDMDDGRTDSNATGKKKETKLELKVPICCSECSDSVRSSLYALKGVKAVECNTRREKVTVVAPTAAAADILMECRKLFRKSRIWSDDD